jgi:hypothetical protein
MMPFNDSIVCLDEEENSSSSNDLITVFDSSTNSLNSKKSRYNPPKVTFSNNAELMTFIKMLRNINDESPAKWHQAIELFDLYFTEQQARFILKSLGKEDLSESIRNSHSKDKKNYIYHHVVFCRGNLFFL